MRRPGAAGVPRRPPDVRPRANRPPRPAAARSCRPRSRPSPTRSPGVAITPPMTGSIAALARWNSRMQPAKMIKERLRRRLRRLAGGDGGSHRACAGQSRSDPSSVRMRSEREQGRDDQRGRHQEHRLVRHEMSGEPHGAGREDATDGGEAGVAPDPFAQRVMADEPQADRRNRRTEHAARHRVQHARGETTRKTGHSASDERADPDRGHRQRRNPPHRAHRVDQRTARHLPGQRDQAADGEDEADIGLGPRRASSDRRRRTARSRSGCRR